MKKYIIVKKFYENCGWQPVEWFKSVDEAINYVKEKGDTVNYSVVEERIYEIGDE